jgi:hypothetical protein
MSRFRISHSIGHVTQPNANDCWAAAAAMARGRVGGRHLTVWDVKRIASRNRVRLEGNGSLPRGNLANTRLLANALNLRVSDMRRVSLNNWLSFLRRILVVGPIVILGGFNYPTGRQATNHAITPYRLFGDTTPNGTTISFVDPYDGRAYNRTWDEFAGITRDDSFLADPDFVLSR